MATSQNTSDRNVPPRHPSRTRDPNTQSQHELPRFIPPEERHVNPIFAREVPGSTVANPLYEPSKKPSARPVDLSTTFAQEVPTNALTKCHKFLQDHPELLREPNLRAKYLDPAAQAWSAGDPDSKVLAFSYLEKCSIISLTRGYQEYRKGDFLTLFRNGDKGAADAFLKTFQKYKQDCEENAKSIRKTQPSVEDDDDFASQLNDLDIARRSIRPRRQSTSQETSHRVSTTEIQRDRETRHAVQPVQKTSRDSQRGAPPDHDHGAHSPTPDFNEEDRNRGGKTPRPLVPRAPIDDYRYQKLEPKEWHYFKPGRVFAIKTYLTESSDRDDSSTIGVRTRGGHEVIEKIRRMVVIKEREGFCLTVPINTYGQQGLLKYGFRQNNINAHARIHMKNCAPVWLDKEPRPGKRDIVVEPDGDQQLHPASRVCFERQHSVDYNERIMKIGTVRDKACLRYLQEYWDTEASRRSSQGQKKTPSTGQGARPPIQPQEGKRRSDEKGRHEW